MMEESLEKRVGETDSYYATKELLVGQTCAFAASYIVANNIESLTDSKLYGSGIITATDFVAFNAAYFSCIYADRRKFFKRGRDFMKYLASISVVAGISSFTVYRPVHAGCIYGFQELGLNPRASTVLSFVLATGAFVCVTKWLGRITGLVKKS